MIREKAIEYFKFHRKIFCEDHLKICPKDSIAYQATLKEKEFYDMAVKALEQEPGEMTVEKYRQRMIQAFHNADCDELIAICVLPAEKEFEHLEWLLKNHYKKDTCEDCVSRQAVLDTKVLIELPDGQSFYCISPEDVEELPPVTPTQKWIPVSERLPEKNMACLVSVGKICLTQIAMYSDLMGTIDHKIFYQGNYGHNDFENTTEYVNAWMPLPCPYKAESEEEE